jgi:hypothetical protein
MKTITFFDPLTEDAQVWLCDDSGKPIEPERPTDKPFHIYLVNGSYRGICEDTYQILNAVFNEMSKKK